VAPCEKTERCLLVIARSRIRSSEFGARNHSFRLTSTNSRPMIGVTSNDLYVSRTPFGFRGSRGYPDCAIMPLLSVEVVVKVLVVMVGNVGKQFQRSPHSWDRVRVMLQLFPATIISGSSFVTLVDTGHISMHGLINSSFSIC
jgi:hypothetical protein